MAHIVWTDDLNTGISEIDNQHRRILKYINELYSASQAGDRGAVGGVVEDMVDYTLSHFAFEESLMEEAGYPLSKPHKRVHEVLTKRVADLHLRHKAGDDVARDLHSLLSRWLVSHIKSDDAAYSRQVRMHLESAKDAGKAGGWLSNALGRFFKK